MSSKRKNAGEGYGFTFHGAFNKKSDAVAKEQSTPGSFVKFIMTKTGPRYAVMAPRKNPRVKKNVEFGEFEKGVFHPWTMRPKTARKHGVRKLKNTKQRSVRPFSSLQGNPGELVILGLNPRVVPKTVAAIQKILDRIDARTDWDTMPRDQAHRLLDYRQRLKERQRAIGNPRPGDYPKPQTRKDVARFVKQHRKSARKKVLGELEGYVRPRRNAARAGTWVHTPGRSEKYRVVEVQGGPSSRRYLLEGPYPSTARVWTRTGRVYPTTAPNPSSPIARAKQMFSKFHGREASGVSELQISAKARKDYTILGPLVAIGINAEKFDKIIRQGEEWDVEQWDALPHLCFLQQSEVNKIMRIIEQPKQYLKNVPLLATSPNGKQLYVISEEPLDIDLSRFDTDATKDLVDLGEATFVNYVAQKPHDPKEWIHTFGEEGGTRPRLVYDRRNKVPMFVGGSYRVEAPGIVN